MLYDNAVQQAIAQSTSKEVGETMVRLATVQQLDNGRAKVQFYGERIASDKLYNYVDGYIPAIGDKVALISQGNTWIILGAITNITPVQKWANVDHNHDGEYLPTSSANVLESGTVTVTLSASSLAPNNNKTIDLGSSAKQFKNTYTEKLYLNGSLFNPVTTVDNIQAIFNLSTYKLTLTNTSGNYALLPNSNGTISLGNNTYKLKNVVSNKLQGAWHYVCDNTSYPRNLSWTASNTVAPDTTNAINLGGTAKQFRSVYANNLYANGTAVTSDERKKNSIKDLDSKYVEMFKKLRPVSFKYNDGESDRTHTGFVAQEVEKAANMSGLETKDCATIVIQDNGEYALRYEEIIAMQTKVIQDLVKRVESLERDAALSKGGDTK